jgi:biopolymer transport protein TolQ
VALGAELEDRGINATELFMGGVGEKRHISEIQMEAVRNVNERNVADQAVLLEGSMGLLATAVSASPFLGLLGTVWGVMDSFGGMAVSGSATLAAVAPGISGALLTTVVGLLVALPSAIGYNLLTNSIRRLTVQMDNFAQEFSADVQRTFCGEQR